MFLLYSARIQMTKSNQIAERKGFFTKALYRKSLNSKCLRLRRKKGEFCLYKVIACVEPAYAFRDTKTKIFFAVHAMLFQAGTSSLPHVNASLIQTWPCAPKLLSPESKAFTASLTIMKSCTSQIRCKKDVSLL